MQISHKRNAEVFKTVPHFFNKIAAIFLQSLGSKRYLIPCTLPALEGSMSREIHRPKPSLTKLGAENFVFSGSGTQYTSSTEERNGHSIANDETICRNRRSRSGGDDDGHEDGRALPSFLPSVRLSLTMQMIQEKIAGRTDADGRTNEGTSLVPPRRRKELFKATLAARTKYVASERTEGTDGHRRAVKQAAKIGTERREKARKVFSHETERRTTREHGGGRENE